MPQVGEMGSKLSSENYVQVSKKEIVSLFQKELDLCYNEKTKSWDTVNLENKSVKKVDPKLSGYYSWTVPTSIALGVSIIDSGAKHVAFTTHNPADHHDQIVKLKHEKFLATVLRGNGIFGWSAYERNAVEKFKGKVFVHQTKPKSVEKAKLKEMIKAVGSELMKDLSKDKSRFDDAHWKHLEEVCKGVGKSFSSVYDALSKVVQEAGKHGYKVEIAGWAFGGGAQRITLGFPSLVKLMEKEDDTKGFKYELPEMYDSKTRKSDDKNAKTSLIGCELRSGDSEPKYVIVSAADVPAGAAKLGTIKPAAGI